MLVQLWAIHRMLQLLSDPMMAAAVVLSVMLAASGAGSALLTGHPPGRSLRRLVPLLLVLGLALAAFSWLQEWLFPASLPLRILGAAIWIALPAFWMGYPFPHALDRIKRSGEIPWALAFNGLGSVLGSLGAALLAVHGGFPLLAAAAIGAYLVILLLLGEFTTRNT
jgi:hypothetical protein